MEAGRELDALVAEKVMGWRWISYNNNGFILVPPDQHSRMKPEYVFQDKAGSREHAGLPRYSTDIAAAWEVVEKLHEIPGYEIIDIRLCSIGYAILAPMGNHMKSVSTAETAPLAICLAALKAVGQSGGAR